MKKKRQVALLFAVIFAVAIPLTVLIGCKKNDKNDGVDDGNNVTVEEVGQIRDYTESVYKTYTPTLSVTDDRVEIGVGGVQKWVFNKNGSAWLFDGVYALSGNNEERVFVGSSGKLDENGAIREDGYYFTVLATSEANGIDKSVEGLVKNITVKENSDKTKFRHG